MRHIIRLVEARISRQFQRDTSRAAIRSPFANTNPVEPVRRTNRKDDYLLKRSTDAVNIFNEYLAWRLYRAAKVPVVRQVFIIGTFNGLAIVQSMARGKQVVRRGEGSGPIVDDLLKSKTYKDGFFVDAFLANWDVLGSVRLNVFLDKDGRSTRIDTGGALDFRGGGKRKGKLFGPKATEMASMGGVGGPARGGGAAEVFARMSEEDFKSAARLFNSFTWPKVQKAIDGALASALSATQDIVNKQAAKQVKRDVKKYAAEMKRILKRRHKDVAKVTKEMT